MTFSRKRPAWHPSIQWFLALICILIQSGCSSKNVKLSFEKISDLERISQLGDGIESRIELNEIQKRSLKDFRDRFSRSFFGPWDSLVMADELFDVEVSHEGVFYGANFLRYSPDWFKPILENARLNVFSKENSAGIVVRATDLRGLPTMMPGFGDPTLAGEGFPFDHWQYSRLYIGAPVRISHFSRDGAWALVKTNEGLTGWIESTSVAKIRLDDLAKVRRLKLGIIQTDGAPVYNSQNRFMFYTRLGQILPILEAHRDGYDVLIPGRLDSGQAVLNSVKISKNLLLDEPLEVNSFNAKSVLRKLVGKPYGWGEYSDMRDCSAMVRDFYRIFGIFLPRNSSQQINAVSSYAFSKDDSIALKKSTLLKLGIPYLTLVYAPGQIAIYIGSKDGEPIIFQSVWANKTLKGSKEGRNVIGQSVVTTLTFGEEVPYYFEDKAFATKLQSYGFILEPKSSSWTKTRNDFLTH